MARFFQGSYGISKFDSNQREKFWATGTVCRDNADPAAFGIDTFAGKNELSGLFLGFFPLFSRPTICMWSHYQQEFSL